MKTHVEELGAVKRKLNVDVPVDEVTKALEAAYTKIQKSAKLKGFRQGHVPRHLLEQYYRTDAESSAMEALIRSSYPGAVAASTLTPVSQPHIEPGPFLKDQPFTYSATMEIYPSVKLETYTGLDLVRHEFTVTEEEISKQVESARIAMTRLVPVDEGTCLAKGMIARIDFDGTADGKPFEGSKTKDYVIDVGGGDLLPAFEEQLTGMKVGEKRAVEFTYPEDYFNINLAGSKGTFDVVCNEIKRKELPELNDDFAKDLGKFETLSDLRTEIRKRLETGKERHVKNHMADQAMKHLLEVHPFEIPETMVGWELEVMYRDLSLRSKAEKKTLADMGVTPESFVKEYENVARDRVRGQLILDAICETEKIDATEDDVDLRLQEIAQSLNEPAPKVRLRYEQQKLIEPLKRQLLHEKALDFIIQTSKIKAEKVEIEKKKSK